MTQLCQICRRNPAPYVLWQNKSACVPCTGRWFKYAEKRAPVPDFEKLFAEWLVQPMEQRT